MPDESPDSIAIANAGVKRLNKRPLIIVSAIIGGLLFALVYAVNQSNKRSHPAAAAPQDQPEQKHAVQDTKAAIIDLEKGLPEGGEVPDPTAAAKASAAVDDGPTGQAANGKAGAGGKVATSGIQAGTGKMTPEEEWLMQYKAAQQKKWQLYEVALSSPTKINANISDGKMNNGTPGVNALPAVASLGAFDSAAERAQKAGDLQSAALKAALGGANADPNGQEEKNDFAGKELRAGYLNATREAPLSRYEIKMGTVLPAIMVSGVNSDLPGELIAQISQDVWDTATGRYLLIPQGSKLFGIYDSHVMFGQNRVLVAWTRLTFPDASTIDLGHMSGADQAGYGGFADQVNNHYLKIFGSAVLMSVISAGVELSQPDSGNAYGQPTAQQTAAAAMAQQLGQTGNALLQKNLNIQPTLEIRPGYRFNVMVSKDIILPSPYSQAPSS